MAVGSVVNAIAILRHVAGHPAQGVNAIARGVSISPSSCFNILKTLADEGFVAFDDAAKSYRLGGEPARLFGTQATPTAWVDWLRDAMADMAVGHGISCALWRHHGNRVTLIEIADSLEPTRIHMTVGQRLPAYGGAMGRCIAAAADLPLDAVEHLLTTIRWQHPPSAKRFRADMREATRRGWAIDDGQYLRGVTTIAAPVTDGMGAIRYCLIGAMFHGRYDAARHAEIGGRLATLARDASDRLAGRPPVDAALEAAA